MGTSEPSQDRVPEFDTIIFYDAAVVQIAFLEPTQILQQYFRNDLHSFLMDKINKVKYADNIVFNIYKGHSIKSTAIESRGFGRAKVSSEMPFPKNWR